ncbi:FeoB small GTPase domain-containing protein [uncultured Clostridium sp.]|uniref:FeoB small GTPase domain-containing protein n=1 Tax=uncultured Clostridium sp. TaxID=59620 RepID=UPI0025F551FE|nr:FeoB small GTPase domain-containing protein [uncultured Clostridium sp.]
MNHNSPFTIALAGTPNVGKSTIFNALTKMHQHTGNWSGKTVACCSGQFHYKDMSSLVVDLPGTYSLRTHSEEEEIAREYIVSGGPDLLLVVCDATCTERGLRLLKQIRDLEDSLLTRVILCVNLCDEAAKKGIELNFELLSEKLNIPVIPCTARDRHGLDRLKEEIYGICKDNGRLKPESQAQPESGEMDYHSSSAFQMCRCCQQSCGDEPESLSAFSFPCDSCPCCGLCSSGVYSYSGETGGNGKSADSEDDNTDGNNDSHDNNTDGNNDSHDDNTDGNNDSHDDNTDGNNDSHDDNTDGNNDSGNVNLSENTNSGNDKTCENTNSENDSISGSSCPDYHSTGGNGTSKRSLRELIPDFSPASLAAQAVTYKNPAYLKRQERIDRLITGRFTGSLIMIALLLAIFWLTITGANYPSSFLWDQFFRLETWLAAALTSAGAPEWIISSMIYGVFRVVAWVVSVMLPPMAIFFPLFTLLEDLGYLPRAAFNMDCAFKKCKACGKQCLTMCLVNALQ